MIFVVGATYRIFMSDRDYMASHDLPRGDHPYLEHGMMRSDSVEGSQQSHKKQIRSSRKNGLHSPESNECIPHQLRLLLLDWKFPTRFTGLSVVVVGLAGL